MVAAIDIGNTNVHVGFYQGEKLIKSFMYPTAKKFVEYKIIKTLANKNLHGLAIASVVPKLTPKFVRCFKKKLNLSPLVISPKLNCHLKFQYDNPETLGADRIANVVGGLARYGKDLIVIDFGTATTFDIVLKNGDYLGGLIIPGIGTSLETLSEKTALLPKITLKKSAKVIGHSTQECIRSGILNSTIAMTKGLIEKIRKEKKKNFLCIATGGWGKMVSSHVKEIAHFDSDLCLYGILRIYGYND